MPAAVLQQLVDFLRAGYPESVPQHDYQPLFALLPRQLTAEEITLVAGEINAIDEPSTATAISDAMRRLTDVEPNERDIARVRAHLTSGGRQLSNID